MDNITVGGVTIPTVMAADWVASYTDVARHSTKAPSAYPAYDSLETGSTPETLNDGDFLAPTLMNAAPSVSAFYRLRAISPSLEAALAKCPHVPLASMAEGTIRGVVGHLYTALDNDHQSHPGHGLGGTTLSKVLHRKSPHNLCLNDKFVWSCYVENGPVPRAPVRTWADYMVELTLAMREDLIAQEAKFREVRRHVKGKEISDLRILDILAWTSKGQSPT